MFEIDKKKFGAFVAELRKEKGFTQKELAQRLYISDKAVSKWETGTSIPDTALLIPLSELLEVSVTELLLCERVKREVPLNAGQVESIVKTAIAYTDERPAGGSRKKWAVVYLLALLIGGLGLYLNYVQGYVSPSIITGLALGTIFGAYFCFFVPTRLPAYYDENRIDMVRAGLLRMNVPGLAMNNSNWPYIVLVGRVWACLSLAVLPALWAMLQSICPDLWLRIEFGAFVTLVLGGLFVPMYVVGKKYE